MIVQQTTPFFVKFNWAGKVEDPALVEGFKAGIDYPVFAVDVIDNDDGTKETSFLLADNTGVFKWVNSDLLRRQSPNHKEGVFRRPNTR